MELGETVTVPRRLIWYCHLGWGLHRRLTGAFIKSHFFKSAIKHIDGSDGVKKIHGGTENTIRQFGG